MLHQNKIEQCLKEIRELEKFFREAQNKEILPISFFSTSIDFINRLRTGIYEIEATQLHVMEEHLKKHEYGRTGVAEIKRNEAPEEPAELKTIILADTIGRKINVDFEKSLSLNDRFMFQRDLFHGNANEMNQAFAQLNASQSLNEFLEFLDEKQSIAWNSEAGITFKELIDKRFA